MHCALVAPGLFAAPAAARLRSLELVLARGRCTSAGSQSLETWLHDAFELEAPLAAGALTLLGAGGEPGTQFWPRADPVHLRLMRDRLILAPGAALHIARDEADLLSEALNRHFAPRLSLQVIDAERWVARVEQDLTLDAQSPLELAGRDVALAMPEASGSRAHELLNESQMVLHSHPANEAREARGEPTANSVWFWGAGRAPSVTTKRWHSVTADDPLSLGLARAAAMRYHTLPGSATAWLERAPEDGRPLIALDALRVPPAPSAS